MKGRKELVVLAGLVVLSLLYMVLHREDRYDLKIPVLSDIAADQMDKVEIAGPKGALVLKKESGSWILAEKGYHADEQKVKDVLETVGGLTLRDLASEAKSYHRFGLDGAERLDVKAFSGEKLLRQFMVGKSASTYQHTYVQLPEDERVYLAKDDFRRHLDMDVQDMRDHVVLKLDEQILERLERQHQGKNDLSLTRMAGEVPAPGPVKDGADAASPTTASPAPPAAQEWVLAGDRKADTSAVEALLRQIKDLRCESFLVGKTPQDFPVSEYVWTFVQKDGKTIQLTVHSKQDEKAEQYVVSVDGVDEPFLISSWSLGNLIKAADSFERHEAQEESGTSSGPVSLPAAPKP